VSPRTVTLYRVLAYTTGVVLLVFTAEIVLKYVFLVSAYLAIALRWSWRWAVPVILAGTIPFASFVAERKVVAKVRAEHPELVSPG
jgi:hypothetical protein